MIRNILLLAFLAQYFGTTNVRAVESKNPQDELEKKLLLATEDKKFDEIEDILSRDEFQDKLALAAKDKKFDEIEYLLSQYIHRHFPDDYRDPGDYLDYVVTNLWHKCLDWLGGKDAAKGEELINRMLGYRVIGPDNWIDGLKWAMGMKVGHFISDWDKIAPNKPLVSRLLDYADKDRGLFQKTIDDTVLEFWAGKDRIDYPKEYIKEIMIYLSKRAPDAMKRLFSTYYGFNTKLPIEMVNICDPLNSKLYFSFSRTEEYLTWFSNRIGKLFDGKKISPDSFNKVQSILNFFEEEGTFKYGIRVYFKDVEKSIQSNNIIHLISDHLAKLEKSSALNTSEDNRDIEALLMVINFKNDIMNFIRSKITEGENNPKGFSEEALDGLAPLFYADVPRTIGVLSKGVRGALARKDSPFSADMKNRVFTEGLKIIPLEIKRITNNISSFLKKKYFITDIIKIISTPEEKEILNRAEILWNAGREGNDKLNGKEIKSEYTMPKRPEAKRQKIDPNSISAEFF
jgi:predicted nucleic acid-binding protein